MKLKKLGIAFSFSHLMLCFFFILPNGNGYMFPTTECEAQLWSFLLLLTLLTTLFYKTLVSNKKFLYVVYTLFAYIFFRGIKAMIRFQFGANLKSVIFFICVCILLVVVVYLYLKDRKKISHIAQNIVLFLCHLAF